MSNTRQEIIDKIKSNDRRAITGNILQGVLLDMFDRDVFLTQDQYDELVSSGLIDEDKIYHIYEE